MLDQRRPHRIRGLLMRRLASGTQLETECSNTAQLIRLYGQYKSPDILLRPTVVKEDSLRS
jgi:hypothetical protein